jgi:hypothetical protein
VKERYERAGRIYPDPNDLNQYKWMSRAGYSSDQMTAEQSFAKHWAELERDLGLTPVPPEPVPTPPGGVMPPMDGFGRTHGTCLGGDKGPLHMLFVSYFPSLKLFRDHRQEWEDQTDRLVGRCLGIRCMFFLVGDPWDGVSNPSKNTRDLTVQFWSDYDSVFVAHGNRLKEKGLRIMLTSGAIAEMPDPENTYRRVAKLCKAIDQQTVTFFEILNEPWMTNPHGGEDWPRWRKYLSIVQSEFPWGIQCTAAPSTQEDPEGLIESAASPSTVATIHGTRHTAADAIRRAFNVKHEGYKSINKPIVAGEEAGPNLSGGAGAVFQPMNNPDDLFALYTMKILTGQGTVYLNGPGLWEQGPIDATWGVKELAAMWQDMGIPNDVGNWTTSNLHQGPIGGGGYARIDGVSNDALGLCFKVASGGSDGFIIARWSGKVTVYRASGIVKEQTVTAGQAIHMESGPGIPCVIRLIRS